MVPMASERGRLRPGSRISSATYADAFHPEYASITGMNANSQLVAATSPPAVETLPNDPVPNAKPAAINNRNAVTLSAASTFIATRPGPTPMMCTAASSQTDATATRVCTENVSGTYGIGIVNSGVWL